MAAQGTGYKLHNVGLLCGACAASCWELAIAVCSWLRPRQFHVAAPSYKLQHIRAFPSRASYKLQLRIAVRVQAEVFFGVADMGSGAV